MITQSQLKKLLHYNPETGIFTWLKRSIEHFNSELNCNQWNGRFSGKQAGTIKKGYVSIWINGKSHLAHRLAYLYMKGEMPKVIDHKDTVKTNNSWSNLRPASMTGNRANTKGRKGNSSGFKGVSFHNREQKYRAAIGIKGKVIQIGHYDCPIEAAKEYDKRALLVFGKYAKTNKMMGLL